MRRRAYAVACRARALLSGRRGAHSRNDVRDGHLRRRDGARGPACVCVRASCGTNVRVIPPGPPTPARDGDITVNHGYKQQMIAVDMPAHARWPLSVFDDHYRRNPHQSRFFFPKIL